MGGKLDKELNEQELHNHIHAVLHHLPMAMRNVFELYSSEQFTLEEVAKITKMDIEEVDQLLKDAKKIIKASFAKRFL